MYKSVVAVGAHPDDIEDGCAGTLAKLASEGSRITFVNITNGEKGSFDDPSMTYEDVVRIRTAEASAAAAVVGGEFVQLGAEDQQLFETKELRLALANQLRRVRAELVLAPPPVDYQADHIRAGEIAREAIHLAAIPQVPLDHPALPYDPVLYYYDPVTGLEFQPTIYVDITDFMDAKREMVGKHVSQIKAGLAEHGWSLLDQVEIVGRFRGLQAGVTYAEGFVPCLRWPRVRALKSFPF
jgi:LmbE family N-acetylglucosaminyl deacetylase